MFNESKQKPNKTTLFIAAGTVILLVLGLWAVLSSRKTVATFAQQGYYPVSKTMAACDYSRTSDQLFTTTNGVVTIEVNFDFENDICYKNQYYFDMQGKWMAYKDKYYVHESVLGAILTANLQ